MVVHVLGEGNCNALRELWEGLPDSFVQFLRYVIFIYLLEIYPPPCPPRGLVWNYSFFNEIYTACADGADRLTLLCFFPSFAILPSLFCCCAVSEKRLQLFLLVKPIAAGETTILRSFV